MKLMKTCPFCAEEIKDAAIVCKHCGRDLPPLPPPSPSPTPDPATSSTSSSLQQERPAQGETRINVREAYRSAWYATWEYFPLWLGVGITFITLTAISSFTVVGVFLLVPAFMWGGVVFLLNMLDGGARFSDLFSGFNGYWSKTGRILALMILLGGINMVGQLFILSETLVGYLITIVWSVTVQLRIMFAFYFLVDLHQGPVEAIGASWRATKDQYGALLMLVLSALVVILLGFLAVIVGVIPASLIVYLALAAAYRQLTPAQASQLASTPS